MKIVKECHEGDIPIVCGPADDYELAFEESTTTRYIMADVPAFALPSDDEIGRSAALRSVLLSSSCNDEELLVTYGQELPRGVLWAWINNTEENLRIYYDSSCELLVGNVVWNVDVEYSEEEGGVINSNPDDLSPVWEVTDTWTLGYSGEFVNHPPVFFDFDFSIPRGIIRGDGTILYSYLWEVDEDEAASRMLTFDFSSLVTDDQSSLEELYVEVSSSPNCDYMNYFSIQSNGLVMELALIPDASTDTPDDQVDMSYDKGLHQEVPESGFYCEVILELYDSPFTPEDFPSHDSYTQGVTLTTIEIRVSNIDDDSSVSYSQDSQKNTNGFQLSILLLAIVLLLFTSWRRRKD